ncbi:MAG: transposase [Acaryochloris sp. RU_4_1]|nr:transposase [Acaryochloris sp. RU_4_1]
MSTCLPPAQCAQIFSSEIYNSSLQFIVGSVCHCIAWFVACVFELMGLELPVPDHSTVSWRMSNLEVSLPIVDRAQARHVVIDSTGIKLYGEGEWKVRQHGVSKRRTWIKLHLAVDESTGEILAAVVSTNDWTDPVIGTDLLEQIDEQ